MAGTVMVPVILHILTTISCPLKIAVRGDNHEMEGWGYLLFRRE